MKLYEWVIIFEGVKDKDDEWKEKPALLAENKTLAENEEQAQIVAARSIPESHLERLDRVTIAVRPF